MADTFQGNIGSISPAIGPYKLQVFINIDKNAAGMTGPLPTGMPEGQNTLEPVKWMMGVTGVDGTKFTNLKPSGF